MILATSKEKTDMKDLIELYYSWKVSGSKNVKNTTVMTKLQSGKLNFGIWKHIAEEINTCEQLLEKVKKRIIILKNQVLFEYITKENAIQEYTQLRQSLVDENEKLKEMYDYYIQNVDNLENELEVQRLEKEYNENLILLKNKMKLVSESDKTKKIKLVTETVRLSMFLTNLSETIRSLKYDTVYVDKNGINTQKCRLENLFRMYKSDSTAVIK